MSEKIRIGMIGTGGISHWHARQLKELDNVEIIAIADPNQQSKDKIVADIGLANVKQFSDYQDMFQHVQLDAVVICSPHTLHFQQAIDSLNNGCHVLIEKPMACSEYEAQQMINTAKHLGKVLQVSYQRHFQPDFLFIRDAIADGLIGNLTSVTASLYQDWGYLTTGSWRQNPALSGGGMLMDSGSHILDVLLWTTGLKPVEVSAQIQKHNAAVELDSFTSIRFENDVIAGVNIVGNAPCWHETYVFCGEKGGIFFDNGKITVRLIGEEPYTPKLPEQTTNQDKSFIDAIVGKHEVLVPGEFAKQVVKLTEMIYQAADYKPIGK